MATRREVMTAAAHKVLLENPDMYRNIANVQALRKEQARRWAQRIIGLNDPGPGAVEQAFMSAGEMSDLIPKLLAQKSNLLKPLADKATEALKQKTGLDETLGKILIANIGAEGQTGAAWLNAAGGLNQEALKQSIEGLIREGEYTRDALGFATPKDEVSISRIDEAYAQALGQSASGGEAPQGEAENLLRTMPPAEIAGLLHKAIETNDPEVVSRMDSLIMQAGKQDEMVRYVAIKASQDKDMKRKFNAFTLGTQVAGEEEVSQIDRMQQTLSRGKVATTPGRGAMLRSTLDAMGNPELIKQLDDAIGQEISDEEKKALRDVDDAIAKASREVDLTSPTEMREQIRTSSGYVEAAQSALEQARIADDGRLTGLGAAARRAARQQSRGLEKTLEGEGEEAKVTTRRLALSKAQSLARKNKAPGWANSEQDRLEEGVKALRAAEKPSKAGRAPTADGSFELNDLDNRDIDVGTLKNTGEDLTFGGGVLPAPPGEQEVSAREKAAGAAQASLDAARASRRSGAAGALKGMMAGFRSKAISEPPETAEDAEDVETESVAEARPPRRPADYWRTRRA